MFRSCCVVLGLSVAAVSSAAVAQEDPIATRKALMRSNGASAGEAQAMIKGEIPFSPAIANAIFRGIHAVGYTFDDYFPEGSETGETRASPRIWEDMEGFQAAVDKLRDDAQAAIDAKPETLEAFQTAFGTVAENCQACHEEYRLPQ